MGFFLIFSFFMEWILSLQWKWFFIHLVGLLILAPIIGYMMVKMLTAFEIAWKSNDKKRRWKACVLAFIVLAIAFGWFR